VEVDQKKGGEAFSPLAPNYTEYLYHSVILALGQNFLELSAREPHS